MIFESYFYIIYITSFFTAIASATFGMIGGTVLLAVMAQWLEMTVLIPLHALVQLLSNSSRAFFLRPHIQWSIVKEVSLGTLLGTVLGSLWMVRPSDHIFNLSLGLFILVTTFLPKKSLPWKFRGRWFLLGIFAIFLGLYFGAIGLLIGAAFLAEDLKKNEMVATMASVQTLTHFAKFVVFVALGFQLTPWLYLLSGTFVFTVAGTWTGTKILNKIPESLFRKLLIAVVILLSLRLIWSGVSGLGLAVTP